MTAPERVKIVPSLSPLDPQNIDRWNVIRFLIILKKWITQKGKKWESLDKYSCIFFNQCVFACINQLSTMDMDSTHRNHRRKPQVFYP